MDELELVARCKNGDRDAFELLYRCYAPRMMGIAMRYVGSEEVSKDMLHDSFLKIVGAINRFEYRGVGSLMAWVSSIVVNTALAHLKKRSKLMAIEEFTDRLSAESDSHEDDQLQLYDAVSDEVIVQQVSLLPLRLRLVFNLFMFEDMPHELIAQQLEISESASRVCLHRAKVLLAEALKEYVKNRKR